MAYKGNVTIFFFSPDLSSPDRHSESQSSVILQGPDIFARFLLKNKGVSPILW